MKRTSLKRLLAGFFAGSISLVFMACSDFVSDAVDEVHSISGSLEMVTVTGGTFNNGTTDMTVSTFAISKYEITQEQLYEVMNYGFSDQEGYGDNYPVFYVSWGTAVEFCNALSEREGYEPVYTHDGSTYIADFSRNGYRLPTEAEWEFAARGGNHTHGYMFAGSNNPNDVAWYEGNSDGNLHTVGRKAPNELGLYDMSGNVAEWCHDWYSDYPDSPQTDYAGPSSPPSLDPLLDPGTQSNERVIRGGNFAQGDALCFVNDRGRKAESTADLALGFRVVRAVDGPVNGVSVYPASLSIVVGGTVSLTATVTPPHAADKSLTWETSNPAVATVSATGQVTGVSLGEATITVTTVEGGFTATCAVSVRASTDIGGMILVNGGTFNNGVADMLVSSFLLGSCEVTQELYTLVTGTNPVVSSSIYGYGDNYPVYNITWIDAVTFCNELSVMQGFQTVYTINGTSVTADLTKNGYRLPTEAEWEFAARGGNSTHGYTYAGSETLGDVAWYENNADNRTHPVGTKAANELGFHDMSGNVSEWCYDWYGGYPDTTRTDYTGVTLGEDRVIRGGSWRDSSWYHELSTRNQREPIYNYNNNDLGFRVARNSDTGTAVSGVTITPSLKMLVSIGDTAQLVVNVIPFHATNQAVTWSSSNSSVVSVSSAGLVTAVSAGSATITATTVDGGYTANCTVKVCIPSASMAMVPVDGGTFNNGRADMTVSAFLIGTYEVTQKQYADVMGANPVQSTSPYGYGDDYPLYNVSWYDAVAFCNALSAQDGYEAVYTISGTTVTADYSKNGYRLPTEAEWEFAAQGGNSTHGYRYAGSDTLNDVAWYQSNAGSTTHPVGSKAANEPGIYDMSGNVSEWCNDWYTDYPSSAQNDYTGPSSGSYRVQRGGGIYNNTYECEVSARGYTDPQTSGLFGFRVVRAH